MEDEGRLSVGIKAILVLLSLIISSVSGNSLAGKKLGPGSPDFLSIDCGSPSSGYVDDQLGFYYQNDTGFIQSGEAREIPSGGDVPTLNWQHLKTLRRFPSGPRNCYTLKPREGRYLVRATFWYGNYDSLGYPPIFNLSIGINTWATVNTSDSDNFYQEIIYDSHGHLYVCLIDIGKGVPIISALELRPLDRLIYPSNDVGTTLVATARYGIGNSQSTDDVIRPSDDTYDRIWRTMDTFSYVTLTSSSAIKVAGSNDPYQPPASVMRTAITTENASDSIFPYSDLDWHFNYYAFFHFAELEILLDGKHRIFNICLDVDPLGKEIEPSYLLPTTERPQSSSLDGFSLWGLSLTPTKNSDLPPILNAYEVYRVLPILPSTDQDSVDAMRYIKQHYNINRDDWQGDPCLIGLPWSGVNCSPEDGNPPKITTLNLSYNNLTGSIISEFSNLTSIQSLILSHNNLTGDLPEFLGQMSSLSYLDLSGNLLNGSIPKSILQEYQEGNLFLKLCGNPDLPAEFSCQEYNQSSPSSTKSNCTALIIALCSSVPILLLIIIFVAVIKRKKVVEVCRKSRHNSSGKWSFQTPKNREFLYSDLVNITDGFKYEIGEGGFGKVYRGTLEDGSEVAIKLLSESSRQGYMQFHAEAKLLMKVHHRNLVSLVGFCHEGNHMALVYEFMENGSLQKHMQEKKIDVLSWKERLQIAAGSARGLDYLHNGCKPPIIHRDMKPSNILLNEKMQAKISDFGVSKAFATDRDSHLYTGPAGTPGYLDPEYHNSGRLTKKSDVYSIGVVLLELITGKSAIIRGTHSTHIITWVGRLLERGDIMNIMDPNLQGNYGINSAWKVVEVAMACVQPIGIQRPDINYVYDELKECLKMGMGTERSRRMDSHVTPPNGSMEMSLTKIEVSTLPKLR